LRIADRTPYVDLQNISGTWTLNRTWADKLGWGNLTGFSLNQAWSGLLLWANITGFNLNVAWTGMLGWGNITGFNLNQAWAGTLGLGNITNPTNCTAGQFVTGKDGSSWLCTAEQTGNTTNQIFKAVDNATFVRINGSTMSGNISYNTNAGLLFNGNYTYNNGTCVIIKGRTTQLELC
jgi:hypothetical protein